MELLPSSVEDKTFKVVFRGYDRDEVHEFLRRLSEQMAELSERAKTSAVRSQRLERESLQVRQSADEVVVAYYEGREARPEPHVEADAEAAPLPTPPPMSEQHPSIETMQILAKAREDEAAADAMLQRAFAASERVETETEEILAAVRAEVDEIRAEAERDAERTRSEAARSASELRRSLEDEERDLLQRVRDLRATLAKLEEQGARDEVTAAGQAPQLSAAEAATTPMAPPASVQEPKPKWEQKARFDDVVVAVDVNASADGEENIAVALTDPEEAARNEPESEPVAATAAPSRYKMRSASLPQIGKAASSVLGEMDSLRPKE